MGDDTGLRPLPWAGRFRWLRRDIPREPREGWLLRIPIAGDSRVHVLFRCESDGLWHRCADAFEPAGTVDTEGFTLDGLRDQHPWLERYPMLLDAILPFDTMPEEWDLPELGGMLDRWRDDGRPVTFHFEGSRDWLPGRLRRIRDLRDNPWVRGLHVLRHERHDWWHEVRVCETLDPTALTAGTEQGLMADRLADMMPDLRSLALAAGTGEALEAYRLCRRALGALEADHAERGNP